MGLKTRLAVQNIVIIAVTVAITVVSCYLYISISLRFGGGAALTDEPIMLVTEKGKPVYASHGLSDAAVKGILMELDISNNAEYNGVKYTAAKYPQDSMERTVYVLMPMSDSSSRYFNIAVFVVIVFLLTFIIAAACVSENNRKNIVRPITRLKDSTLKLAGGDLNTVIESGGTAEIGELCDCVEQLRLRLKESVYYREKYDDNRKFLISGISHDLRTPVTAVRGYIEGVLDGVALTDEKRSAYLKTALLKLNSINEMIDDLLLYSKLDLNKLPFEITTVDIFDYISECVSYNESDFAAQQKTLTLKSELLAPRRTAIDSVRFKRVIQNILGNALKNTIPITGAVAVILRENANSVIIEVRDNGAGINKEDLPYIFDRFYRGDSSRKVTGSSGLGLTIAKQIVEGLGGRIWATSSEGNGASIIISLKKEEA